MIKVIHPSFRVFCGLGLSTFLLGLDSSACHPNSVRTFISALQISHSAPDTFFHHRERVEQGAHAFRIFGVEGRALALRLGHSIKEPQKFHLFDRAWVFKSGLGFFIQQESSTSSLLLVASYQGQGQFVLRQTLRITSTQSLGLPRVYTLEDNTQKIMFTLENKLISLSLNHETSQTQIFPLMRRDSDLVWAQTDWEDMIPGFVRFDPRMNQISVGTDLGPHVFSVDGRFMMMILSGHQNGEGGKPVVLGLLMDTSETRFTMGSGSRWVGLGVMRNSPFADFSRQGEREITLLHPSKPVARIQGLQVERLSPNATGEQNYYVKADLVYVDGSSEFIRIPRFRLATQVE